MHYLEFLRSAWPKLVVILKSDLKIIFENRKKDRYEYTGGKLEYTLSPFSADKIFEADVIDFSQLGLCILSANYIAVGEEITIRNFMNYALQTAKVIRVEKTDEGLFKIGLSIV
ncbi:MAG: hypothetical protein WC594_09640 [Thermodesulfovibrionales bacterium]